MEVFPKRKELASLKQLFVLHGNEGNFLYASPLNAGTYGASGEDKHRFARWRLICSRVYVTKDKRKNTHSNERSDVASKSPASLFELLRHFSMLNKKNSLRSNRFLFLTLRKAPPLYVQKVRSAIPISETTFILSIYLIRSGI